MNPTDDLTREDRTEEAWRAPGRWASIETYAFLASYILPFVVWAAWSGWAAIGVLLAGIAIAGWASGKSRDALDRAPRGSVRWWGYTGAWRIRR